MHQGAFPQTWLPVTWAWLGQSYLWAGHLPSEANAAACLPLFTLCSRRQSLCLHTLGDLCPVVFGGGQGYSL